jgi:hypothetical protein
MDLNHHPKSVFRRTPFEAETPGFSPLASHLWNGNNSAGFAGD